MGRCTVPSFSLTVPPENVYGTPEGTFEPAVDDGVYLLLAPLKAGWHTISFGGSAIFLGSEFSENITYHLVVVSGG